MFSAFTSDDKLELYQRALLLDLLKKYTIILANFVYYSISLIKFKQLRNKADNHPVWISNSYNKLNKKVSVNEQIFFTDR